MGRVDEDAAGIGCGCGDCVVNVDAGVAVGSEEGMVGGVVVQAEGWTARWMTRGSVVDCHMECQQTPAIHSITNVDLLSTHPLPSHRLAESGLCKRPADPQGGVRQGNTW